MEFIKRHYEKLLLAGLLLLFIGSMIYLIQIMRDTGSIRREDLQIPTRQPDFRRCDEKSPDFDISKNLFGMAEWTPSKARPGSRYDKTYSDLVVTFGAARCGHEQCGRIIPLYYFGMDKPGCPWCRKKLAEPPKQVVFRTGAPTVEDPDGCGIPHRIKEQYGLSVSDPANVLDDMDNDGFSNLYEHKNHTTMNVALSHPPLWHRLIVKKIERVKLPVQLKAIMPHDKNRKDRWDIQINMFDPADMHKFRKTEYKMLNESLKIEDNTYTIKDAVYNLEKKDASGNPIDNSYIDLVTGKDMHIRMYIGKDVYTPDARAVLEDIATGKTYVLGVGQMLRMGNRRIGRSRYTVKTIDAVKKEVMLDEVVRGSGKPLPEPITRQGKIAPLERVRVQKQSAEEPQQQEMNLK